jgi:hypothetical protein
VTGARLVATAAHSSEFHLAADRFAVSAIRRFSAGSELGTDSVARSV